MWRRKEKVIVVCPFCHEEITETHHVGITQIRSIVHLYCGGWSRPGEYIIDEGTFKKIVKKYL